MADTKPANDAANGPTTAENISRDGEKVKDDGYYKLLGVRADATDSQIKTAYRKAALKYHPDRNRDDPNAETTFQEIGEAYQVLSDNDLRGAYDRYGKKGNQATPEEGFMDPGQLFAQLFGGERFFDWIGEISMGKDFTKAMDISMSEEEKEAMRAEAAADSKDGATGAVFATTPAAAASQDASTSAASASKPDAATASTPATAPVVGEASSATASTSTPGTELHKHSATSPPTTSKPGKPSSNKLTPEQRKQMEALGDERRKNEIERIHLLTEKLKDRIRPYVQSAHPGDANDPECQKWEARMREEVDDLKGQSFGVELCQLIGQIYVTKSSAYIKAHKTPLSNILGVNSWWGRMKDKGATIKEGYAFLQTTMEVQSSMAQMEKEGEMAAEAQGELEQAFMGKLMLVTWKGTQFEVASVLRQTVDGVLSKKGDKKMSEVELVHRAKAILMLGTILKNVQVDETDEERREMERLVAQANADRKKKKPSKKEKA